ncbi:hypothetical protein WJX73_001551 [Symbiochloris irregularis]|uniref:Uncharacterized protein n=1 Tax=Symbiochloris irregularis TaxID=706552 RepID=A0AAW1PND0_9CHLO
MAADLDQSLRSKRLGLQTGRRTSSTEAEVKAGLPLQSFLSTVTTDPSTLRNMRFSDDTTPDTSAALAASAAAAASFQDAHRPHAPSQEIGHSPAAMRASPFQQHSHMQPATSAQPSDMDRAFSAMQPSSSMRPASSMPQPAASMHPAASMQQRGSMSAAPSQPLQSKFAAAPDDPFAMIFPVEVLQPMASSAAASHDSWGDFEGEAGAKDAGSAGHADQHAPGMNEASQNGEAHHAAELPVPEPPAKQPSSTPGSIDLNGRRISGHVSGIPIPDLSFMLPAHVRSSLQ